MALNFSPSLSRQIAILETLFTQRYLLTMSFFVKTKAVVDVEADLYLYSLSKNEFLLQQKGVVALVTHMGNWKC